MFIGNYYYEPIRSLPTLTVTSAYFVIFCFVVFCLSRPFKSFLRPLILLVANFIFVYSFGLNNLLWLSGFSLMGYVLGLINGKYHNKHIVIVSSLIYGVALLGYKLINLTDSSIIIPLGLSFYSFKIISYLCDIYSGKIKAEKNIIYYLDYVMFFPCITAGPINRADAFLKEIRSKHEFDYQDIATGFFLVACGIFEKLVFCDFIGSVVTKSLNVELSGLNTLLGVVLYSFQIYLDFDSISNIAIGTARMLGFKLERNFHVPYLAISIKDFWNRWHISLSSWLRDYIYFPLGGGRKGDLRKYLNVLIVFFVSSLWHGITLNFLIWGMGHGVIRVVEDLIAKLFKNKKSNFFVSLLLIFINFTIVTTLWIFFKYDFSEAIATIQRIFVKSPLNFETIGLTHNEVIWLCIVLSTVVITDILRYFFDLGEFFGKHIFIIRFILYAAMILLFLVFGMYGGSFDANDFIYRWF